LQDLTYPRLWELEDLLCRLEGVRVGYHPWA
jgi:hypothetical protein